MSSAATTLTDGGAIDARNGGRAPVASGRRRSPAARRPPSPPVARAAASALANAIVSSSGDRMSASFSRSPDEARREVEQLRARAAIEAAPLALVAPSP